MATRQGNRKSALAKRKEARKAKREAERSHSTEDEFFRDLCQSIYENQLIPIIGDTVRNEHIFDVDLDQGIGIGGEPDEDDFDNDSADTEGLHGQARNITETLAELWADEDSVKYPLIDRYRLARVAQFLRLKLRSPYKAKNEYLRFQRKLLLEIATDIAKMDEDDEFLAVVDGLKRQHELSFPQIVSELDFPRFPAGKEDPLHMLAQLPLSIYLTTGYYDFMERALIAEGRKPRTRFCLWNLEPANVDEAYRPDPDYTPSVDEPLVYHLYGVEKYPVSMVLSEDDYLDFLWKLARDELDTAGNPIFPPALEAKLRQSSWLLLGYRLQDWDFRVLFRGLLMARPEFIQQRRPSVAIQLDPKDQPDVDNVQDACLYLTEYFGAANFRVQWGNSDNFITKLKQKWLQWNSGDSVT